MNSHQDLDMNDSFHVDVDTMELPKGGARLPITSLVGEDNSLARKRSIIQLKNSDNNCLAAAVGVAYASANTISTREWRDLTKHDNDLSMPKRLLKYGKCPLWYIKHLSQRPPKQDALNTIKRRLIVVKSHRANAGGNAPFARKSSTENNKTLKSTRVTHTFVNATRK